MPNLLDCPQEIQDMIYEAYFSAALAADAEAPLHDDGLLRASHRIAADAIHVRNTVSSPSLFRLYRANPVQVALTIMTSEMEHTDSSRSSTCDEMNALSAWGCSQDSVDILGKYLIWYSKWEKLRNHLDQLHRRVEAQGRVMAKLETQAEVLRQSRTDGE